MDGPVQPAWVELARIAAGAECGEATEARRDLYEQVPATWRGSKASWR